MKLIGNILNNKKIERKMRFVIVTTILFLASCGTGTTTEVATDVVTDTVVAVDTVTVDAVTVDTVVETVTDTVAAE